MKVQKDTKQCLFPGCERPPFARGLCKNHYVVARRLIRESKATDQGLVRAGKMLPKKSGGRTTEAQKWFLEDA